MTLPVSGAISFNAINVELGVAGTTQASLNQASYRTLANVPSGAISMSNFYGKSNRVTASITISANTANYVLNTAKVTGYAAGTTDVTLTINSGVTVFSNSTGSYAFDVDTSWTAGDTITIVNSGVILGGGGGGGSGSGGVGGPALRVQRAVSFDNVNRIAGGGGGGGQGGTSAYAVIYKGYAYGGGGGGGIGNGAAGAGGSSPDFPGSNGSAGTLTAPGGGGGGGYVYQGTTKAGPMISYAGGGGSGGTYGSSGASGGDAFSVNYGPQGDAGSAGGAAGGAVVGNSNITWVAFGTRNGSIS